MQWDVEPVAAQMTQMASDLTARIDALDPESESPVFSDFSFAIATGDWELTNGLYKARVINTVLLTANAGIQVFYDQTLRTSVVGDIFEDKHTGYIDFYTTIMPTGSVTGFVRVIDATGGNVQVSRGGTGASTPKGARTNLNTPIRDIPVNFGTVSSLPQTIYDADLTADMIAFDAVFGNPAAIPGGIDVTFAAGSVTITGTLVSGQETTISFFAHEKRGAVEGTETPSEQQRITEFVQVQAQTLTAAQQTQVRSNIGAASASDLSALNNMFPTDPQTTVIDISANSSVRYRKIKGIVHVRFGYSPPTDGGVSAWSSKTLYTLPEGYRPSMDVLVRCMSDRENGSAYAIGLITTTGSVQLAARNEEIQEIPGSVLSAYFCYVGV